ncbi:hypothetical protein MAPG_00626 [Magnaporthiopsis poae ATCC 64411]|uniref:Deacetylase complex subunit Sds3 n=1 Tax=Magnaporthiopsis poae (strain ATCC 64411 / 73-15) TaxID=644358 RepID=A0A0C4DLI2_MAGP6|nr:hypothetical protein MAPG_00626 [Magnaporthiopsis poae ATCC 64411]
MSINETIEAAHAKPDRRSNPSPPPTLSKREKKRQLLVDRLASLSEQFDMNRDREYREMLAKIQVDTALVMQVDPYAAQPLAAIDREQSMSDNIDPQFRGRTVLEMAGPKFQEWVNTIEDLVERRDFELTRHKDEFDMKSHEHRNVYIYKTEVAKREHRALSQTLRDRLINAINSKRARLTKEKEAFEISDASALLLHPNQYSITNPASPGGTHTKRATRLRQNAEEVNGYSDGRKRKRNGAEDDGSPAPQRRALDPNNTTPLWQNDRLVSRKATGPIYSIDKLFTDKELAMQYNTAALAAHKYLLTSKSKTNGSGGRGSPDDSDAGENDDGDQEGSEPIAAAPTMERVPSHATRSRGGANNSNFIDEKIVGLEALTNFEIPGNLEKMAAAVPKLPPMFLATYAKSYSNKDGNSPTVLPPEEVNSDLMVMSILRQYEKIHGVGSNFDNANGCRKVLEATAFNVREGRYAIYLDGPRNSPEELRTDLKLPLSSIRGPPTPNSKAGPTTAPGASPMSRQSSQGGVAMARQGSNTTRTQRRRN